MRYIIWTIAILLLLIIQAGVMTPLHIFPVNLVLVLAVVAVLVSDFNQGLFIAVVGGIAMDLISGTADGIIALTMLSIFAILYLALNFQIIREQNNFTLFIAVATATFAYFVFFPVFNRLFEIFNLGRVLNIEYFWTREFPLTLIFNLLFAYPILQYYLWIHSKLKVKA